MKRQDSEEDRPKAKRNKPTKSCGRCHKRKIKCDLSRPSCANCFASNVACVYQQKEQTVMIDLVAPPVVEEEEDPLTIAKLDIPLNVRNDIFELALLDHQNNPAFPFIPKAQFLKMAQESPLLFNAVCACHAPFVGDHILEGMDKNAVSMSFWDHATASFAEALKDRSLAMVFAYAYMFIYARRRSMTRAALNFRRACIVSALDLQLHQQIPIPQNQQELTEMGIRVNTFWFSYYIDHFYGAVLKMPPILQDHVIQVPLPFKEAEFVYQNFLNRKRDFAFEIGVMQSSGYVPSMLHLPPIGHYTVLSKIFCNAAEYVRELENQQTGELISQAQVDLAMKKAVLLSSLEHWEIKSGVVLPRNLYNGLNWFNYYQMQLCHAVK